MPLPGGRGSAKKQLNQIKKKCILEIFERTFVGDSKLPLWKIVCLINFQCVPDYNQELAMKRLGLASSTVVNWVSYAQEVMVRWEEENKKPICGPITIVEIDETFFTKRKYNKGRNVCRLWIFSGVQHSSCFKFNLSFPVPEITDA